MSNHKISWKIEFSENAAVEREQLDAEHTATLKQLIEKLSQDPVPQEAHRLPIGNELWQLVDREFCLCLTYIIVNSLVMIIVVQVWSPDNTNTSSGSKDND